MIFFFLGLKRFVYVIIQDSHVINVCIDIYFKRQQKAWRICEVTMNISLLCCLSFDHAAWTRSRKVTVQSHVRRLATIMYISIKHTAANDWENIVIEIKYVLHLILSGMAAILPAVFFFSLAVDFPLLGFDEITMKGPFVSSGWSIIFAKRC